MGETRKARIPVATTAVLAFVATLGLSACEDPVADTTASAAPAAPASSRPYKIDPGREAAGLTRYDVTGVPVDPGEVRAGMNVTAADYGPKKVLLVGIDGLRPDEGGKRMEHLVRGMIQYINSAGGSVPDGVEMKTYPAGPLGGTLECSSASSRHPAVVCAWADKDTSAVAHLWGLSPDEAAKLFLEIRNNIER